MRGHRDEAICCFPSSSFLLPDNASVVPSPRAREGREQVPSVLCLDATPERDAAPQSPACLCAPPRSHPQESGPLLHVPAHPLPEGEGALSRLRALIDREGSKISLALRERVG